MAKPYPPVHPGTILMRDLMTPHDVSQNALASALGVPTPRINAIVHGRRAITADTALRLARFFGTTPEFWTNLQIGYDLKVAKRALAGQLDRIPSLPRPDLVDDEYDG
ncbi:MAG: vapI [Cyanobacteria bacterium RYN_339]|nr:vapI [Cyanobacteria bacterium RYN_339]